MSESTVKSNGNHPQPQSRADEVAELLDAVQNLIIPYIRSADPPSVTSSSKSVKVNGAGSSSRSVILDHHKPDDLKALLQLDLPEVGAGKDGLVTLVEKVLQYSVNTWDQGFLDKLYASTNAVGVVSELLLAVLNTNVHVYQVSPVLTLIEKHITTHLSTLFGFTQPHSGGISQPGGSASNASSLIIARNTLYPSTKTDGLSSHRFTIFTSSHGHYSIEKAAQTHGFGSKSVIPVPVDDAGQMLPSELRRLVRESKEKGEIPFYVNATAGTTVLGSFDPFEEIGEVCEEFGLWFHIDGSWGGSVVFAEDIARDRLRGCETADSITVNPHKMLGVPMTCSFLLGKDMRKFWKAMTLPAEYLFHTRDSEDEEVYDLGDLTPQCGRRGDALKFHLSWVYYGKSGLCDRVTTAYARAEYLFTILSDCSDFTMVSKRPLPCLQVCFYYTPGGVNVKDVGEAQMSRRTEDIASGLVGVGWMVDYAPGEGGKFFRVVVNAGTEEESLRRLVASIRDVGKQVVEAEERTGGKVSRDQDR